MKMAEAQKKEWFLAVDIGNTHTVLGLYRSGFLASTWRIHTKMELTGDELFCLLCPLLKTHNISLNELETILLSSVVPPATEAWNDLTKKYPGPMFADAHDIALKLVKIKYPHPHEVGTDRLLNSIAAFRKFKRACIVVDYGTATTFDCISSAGEYLGGVIAPGILLAARSLFTGTSKLPMVKFPTEKIAPIGTSTETAIQSGLLYGFAGLTDNIIENISKVFDKIPYVVCTGGLSHILFDYCSKIDRLEPDLTMEGLLHCHEHLKNYL